jgi:pimeloyl-ACP methyl ester carboxylesterase
MREFKHEQCLFLLAALFVSSGLSAQLPKLKAAVLLPGFLTGAAEFQSLVNSLTSRGIPTIAVPMPNWHWLPCMGGRSVRPILERLDCTVRWMAANAGKTDTSQNPELFDYSLQDLYQDFRENPGGIYEVGGSDKVNDYPVVEPKGRFLDSKDDPKGSIALIGHSAGGWISRVYLSERNYGGRVYAGQGLVHSLVTLGTPHANAPGPAFEGISWSNEEPPLAIRQLAVGGTGFLGGDWGAFTAGAYAFCGLDGSSVDGDGVTPIISALALPGAEQLVVDHAHHFCWSEVFGGSLVAPELTKDHKQHCRWYGSESVLDQWAGWLDV